jgi:RNA polymerase sigma-70 factor, ECF subfamily
MENTETDEELVARIRRGEILAFEKLVERYKDKIFRYCARFLGEDGDAQEVVQDVMFAVYRKIDNIDASQKFSSYLYAIAKNMAISRLRKRGREVPLLADVADEQEDVTIRLGREEIKHKVTAAISKLPGKQKQAIDLYYFQDLSYEQISKKLAVPLNTVRTFLYRAKLSLKALLENETS